MEIPRPVVNFHTTSIYKKAKNIIRTDLVTVLYGLSGSGKTQICAHLAFDYKRDSTNRVFFTNAKKLDFLRNDISEISTKLNLNLEISKKELLAHLLEALSSSSATEVKTYLILNDVEDEEVLGEVLQNLNIAGLQGHLNNTSVIVTSQVKPSQEYQENQRFCTLHVEGFSKEEAKDYLKIPPNRADEVLDCISCLPVALNPFKQAFKLRLEHDDDYIDRYLGLIKESSEKNRALLSLKICLDKAVAGNLLLKNVLKYLSVFCGEDITMELLVALIEEVDASLGVDEASSIVEVIEKRSIGNTHMSDTQRKYLTLHSLVKEAVNDLVQDGREWPEILRISLQAFNRIMPCDNRHHQSDIVPKMLKHALSLHKSYEKITQSFNVDGLTKLLFAELHNKIGYFMISLKHDIIDVRRKLEEGMRLFLQLFFQGSYSSNNYENNIKDSLKCESTRKQFMPYDSKYRPYIESLQVLYRLSQRDFKTIFPEVKDRDQYKYKKSGHLSIRGLQELKKLNNGSLLPVDTLAIIYPLELFAQNLLLLSWSYDFSKSEVDQRESVKISQKADTIYNSIKDYCGVTLLGLYINKCFLYSLKTKLEGPEELKHLCKDWEDLRKDSSGMAYESGVVRSKERSEDKYHQLICYEGEMLVWGVLARQTSEVNQKREHVAKGKALIEPIETLCRKHERPYITLSTAFLEVSKFYQYCEEFQEAISYSVKSMIEYRNYWLDMQSVQQEAGNRNHPELDDDKIMKFIDCYKQLESCLKSFKENRELQSRPLWLNDGQKNYLKQVYNAWQGKCVSAEEGGDRRFEAIDEVLKLVNQEARAEYPALDE